MSTVELSVAYVPEAEPGAFNDSYLEHGSKRAAIRRNVTETDLDLGTRRLTALTPYALHRLGRDTEITTEMTQWKMTARWSVRANLAKLTQELVCGVDFLFELARKLERIGPENARASDMLKKAPDGGRGKSKLKKNVREALGRAVEKVCVTRMRAPGRATTIEEIRCEMVAEKIGADDLPCHETIRKASRAPEITVKRSTRISGAHLGRLVSKPDEIRSHLEVVQLDGTTFTTKDSPEKTLYAMDRYGRVLGIVNALFGLEVGCRGIWTALPVVGAINGSLAGLAIHRGLLAKDKLLERLGVRGRSPIHGKPRRLVHDNGREFVGRHVKRVLKDMVVLFDESCPPYTPYFRGPNERFNRTAHELFAAFLKSDEGKRYFRALPGRMEGIGILFEDLDRAFWDWIVNCYHERPHDGLGGVSPMQRFEQMARGLRGLPISGYPVSLADTPTLFWDFMSEDHRVVNHLGIHIMNRRYSHPKLTALLQPGKRSSEKKIAIRYNDYALDNVWVKVPLPNGGAEVLCVPWVHEADKLPLDPDMVASITSMSRWEWSAVYGALRRAGVESPKPEQMIQTAAAREQNDGAGGGHREGRRDRSNREMRRRFGGTAGALTGPGQPEAESRASSRCPTATAVAEVPFLPTGAEGANEY